MQGFAACPLSLRENNLTADEKLTIVCIKMFALPLCPVPDDLSPEERQELECIRRRKEELLLDIQVTNHTKTHSLHAVTPQ